jgi:hypothetical protein
MFEKDNSAQTFPDPGQNIFFHLPAGMVAQPGMDMTIYRGIYHESFLR